MSGIRNIGVTLVLTGHTHIPTLKTNENGVLLLNPGSVSIPKEGSAHSFMTFENGVFKWFDLETGETYKEYCV